MEDSMDCSNQPSGDIQSVSSKERLLPSSLAQSQALSTPPAEHRPFGLILGLTLLLGIMLGIFLTLLGGVWYVSEGFIPSAFSPSSPLIYRSLGPLTMTSFGVIPILLGRVQRLRRQHLIFQFGRFDLLNAYPWPFTSVSFGLLFIWIGGSQVILLWLVHNPSMWGTIQMVGIVILIIALFAELFFLFVRKHHIA